MNKTRLKFFLGNFHSATVKMSTKPPVSSSHYDTLKVNSRSTQGEIKSAYFKLSKQYHPDKNSSNEAIEKFRNITEAYEVLGNYHSRKVYDRSLITKSRFSNNQRTDVEERNIKYYQSQAAVFKHTQKSGSTPTYDFDAWTKAHYGNTFRRSQIDKMETAQKRQDREDHKISDASMKNDMILVTVAVVLVFITLMFNIGNMTSRYDIIAVPIQKTNVKEISEVKSELPDLSEKSVSSN